MSPMTMTHTDPLAGLAAAVTDARERLGWSLNQAAARADCDRRSWSSVERGTAVRDSTYRSIASAFAIDPQLFADAAADADQLAALVDALTNAQPDGPLSDIDLSVLEDAALFLAMEGYMKELQRRCSDRLESLHALVNAKRNQPEMRAIIDRITRALQQGNTNQTEEQK